MSSAYRWWNSSLSRTYTERQTASGGEWRSWLIFTRIIVRRWKRRSNWPWRGQGYIGNLRWNCSFCRMLNAWKYSYICDISLSCKQERKRIEVVEEQQRKLQEAMASRPPPSSEDNLEIRAVKAMGVLDNGDEVFGNSDEVNVDSQVFLSFIFIRSYAP